MKIFIIKEYGDDYHGSRIVKAYKNEKTARRDAKFLYENQKPCSDSWCDHKYSYFVTELELDER